MLLLGNATELEPPVLGTGARAAASDEKDDNSPSFPAPPERGLRYQQRAAGTRAGASHLPGSTVISNQRIKRDLYLANVP